MDKLYEQGDYDELEKRLREGIEYLEREREETVARIEELLDKPSLTLEEQGFLNSLNDDLKEIGRDINEGKNIAKGYGIDLG